MFDSKSHTRAVALEKDLKGYFRTEGYHLSCSSSSSSKPGTHIICKATRPPMLQIIDGVINELLGLKSEALNLHYL